MAERPEPDIFIKILNKVEQIDGIAADVREIKNVQRAHGLKLVEHDRRFDRIDQTLAEHTRILAGHDLRLDELDQAVVEVHQDVLQHSRFIAELKPQ